MWRISGVHAGGALLERALPAIRAQGALLQAPPGAWRRSNCLANYAEVLFVGASLLANRFRSGGLIREQARSYEKPCLPVR